MPFSRKKKVQIHPTVSLNNIQIEIASHRKYLDILLDEKLNFKQHIDTVIMKINKGTTVIKQTKTWFATKILNDNYKAFLKPLIDYGDIIHDQPQSESFCEK